VKSGRPTSWPPHGRGSRRPKARRVGGPLEPCRVRFDQLGLVAPEAEGRMTAGVALLGQLGGVALVDASRQSAAVSLGVLGLIDELVPVSIARGQDLFVGEPDGHACRMEGVFEQFEGAAQVALPAGYVADQENIERAVPRWRPSLPVRGRSGPARAGQERQLPGPLPDCRSILRIDPLRSLPAEPPQRAG
jgi:hypothetical protein